MKIIEVLVGYLGVIFCSILINLVFKKQCNAHRKVGVFTWSIILIIFSALTFINNRFNVTETTFIVHFLLLSIMNYLIYKCQIITSFLHTVFIYIAMVLGEILLTFVLIIPFSFANINDFSNNYIFLNLFSIVDIGVVYLLTTNKFSKKYINKFVDKIIDKTEKFNFFLLISILIVASLTAYKLIFDYSSFNNYLVNVLILVLFIGVVVFLFIEALKLVKEKEKQESLLNYMSKYEELIDSQRINRHEMLNNLITLKSFKNKNSKEFTKALDELISIYDKNDLAGLQSIYNLPSGIKGLLYYKIYDIRNKGVEVVVNVGRNTISFFDNLESKYYMEICKVLGILLDNAGEAASKSKEKNVVIDIYKDNRHNKICVYIENSKTGEIDLKTINEKHVSSKGKGRGLGLFIVQGVVNKRECYELIQEVNGLNHFVTSFIIDIEKAK